MREENFPRDRTPSSDGRRVQTRTHCRARRLPPLPRPPSASHPAAHPKCARRTRADIDAALRRRWSSDAFADEARTFLRGGEQKAYIVAAQDHSHAEADISADQV